MIELDLYNYMMTHIEILSRRADMFFFFFLIYTQSNFVCQICAGKHPSNECLFRNFLYPPNFEQDYNVSNYQQNNQYSNKYNYGRKNHPDYSWRSHPRFVLKHPSYAPPKEKPSLEDAVNSFKQTSKQCMQQLDLNSQDIAASFRIQKFNLVKLLAF